MKSFVFQAENEADTRRLGAALAELVPDGTVIALVGTLGAGKTRLVQAIAEASGIGPSEVTSPTFVLCHTYRGRRTLHHFDVYRLREEQEFLELGPDEYFESPAISLVEWGDRIERLLPEHLRLSMEVTGQSRRQITLEALSPPLEPVVAAISERLANK